MSTVAALNRTLRQGEARALELEDRLAALVRVELDRAADVAAANFRALAVDHLAAAASLRRADLRAVRSMGMTVRETQALLRALALTSAVDVQSNSTMVALRPRPEEAAALADEGGYEPERLHVTLCYLGEVDGDLRPIADLLAQVAATQPPLAGVVGGYGQFQMPDESRVGILLPDVPGLVELRVSLAQALQRAGVGYAREHGFTPHVTVDDEPEPGELEELLPLSGSPLHFDALHLVRGDREEHVVPLVGAPALTAAAPKPYCLPAELRGRTDPVRQEVVKTMMKAALAGAGLSFDVDNPLAQAVLAKAASQVTHISKTTQLDVMRAVRAAHEEGLSIPDTATAIRASMKEAAPARARLIARTELAGAVNGGSLASARIVAKATGAPLYKQWLTAAGSKHPRHHKYVGLSGQTVRLDEYFQVGRASLDHPGDPSGPAEEVCNCRCTIIYVETPGVLSPEALLLASSRPPCECPGEPDPTEVIFATDAVLAAAGPSPWSAPAAEEILPTGCEAHVAPLGKAFDEAPLGIPAKQG